MTTALVWFRDDLRVRDNAALRAAADADRLLPVYAVDPAVHAGDDYGLPRIGPHRARFRRESVRDLRDSLRERGSDLVVRHGRPGAVVPALAAECDADTVYFHTHPTTFEYETEHAVRDALPAGVDAHAFWEKTLIHPDDLPIPPAETPDTFTSWRQQAAEDAPVRDPEPAPDDLPPAPDVDPGEFPSLSSLGHDPDPGRPAFDDTGGETRALERVQEWAWEGDNLRAYKRTRNGLLGDDYSSKFSPWLAAGCLSPRTIHAEVEEYERARVSNDSTYWLVFELYWRDYMTFQFEKHGRAFFTETGIRDTRTNWRHDHEDFDRWRRGDTGIPFVDAAMRELAETGYQSNRARQNAASFLAYDLEIDWRWGAQHFQSTLTDFDPCSNWGNWAYQSGTGNDDRDNPFDVLGQAEYYDENAEYVREWCPELDRLPADYAHRPWELSDGLQATYDVELGVDYPRPMRDPETLSH